MKSATNKADVGTVSRILGPLAKRLPESNRLERIWLLAKTDFRKRYNDSWLGLLWALINPLAQLAIYFYVFTVVFKTKTENFALFVFLGLVFWMWFLEATNKGITLIQQKRYLLENIQIDKLDIYYAGILSTFLGFLFNLSVYIVASLFFNVNISIEILLIPLLVLNMAIFIIASQIILSIIHIFIRDITHVWALTSLMLFWLSGILFAVDPAATWKTALLAYLTPLLGVINNARAALIYGEGWNWGLFVYDYVYAFALLGIGLFLIRKYFGRAMELL